MSTLSSIAATPELFFPSKNGEKLFRGKSIVQFMARDSCSPCFSVWPEHCSYSMSWSQRFASKNEKWVRRIVGLWRSKRVRSSSGIKGRMRLEHKVVMRSGGDKSDNNPGDDQVETLFMRELRRRGMSTKGKGSGSLGSSGTDTKTKEENEGNGGTGWSLPGASKSKPPSQLTESQIDEQLKLSMALNSEGLDGLIPRAMELLKLGSSFFLVFWPFIIASLAAFLAVYLYFGTAFVHTGNSFEKVGRPPYVDPYQLLEEQVLPSGVGPDRVP